jgi:hypothetical protein
MLCSSLSALEPVGFAVSAQPFLIAGAPARSNATILAGEAISSNRVPLRVHLSAGHEVILGPGSQAAFWADRVRVEGVSVDFRAAAGAKLTVEMGPLRFEASDGAGAAVYSDRPTLASAWAKGGSVQVAIDEGSPLDLGSGDSAAFALISGELRVQQRRAPLEIARIQIRQLQYVGQMAVTRPGVKARTDTLLSRLAEASDGLLQAEPAAEQFDRESRPAVDSARLFAEVLNVHAAMLSEPWTEAGCGSPDCVVRRRVHKPDDFVGWADETPPPPGCELCRFREAEELQ